MLTSDFNARTGCELDFVDVNHCIRIPGDYLPPLRFPRWRKSFDFQTNEHGKSLLEICKACDLRILNGRTTGGSFGKITIHSPKGMGTVIISLLAMTLEKKSKNRTSFYLVCAWIF